MDMYGRLHDLKDRYAGLKPLILPSIHAGFCTLAFTLGVLDVFFHLDIFSGYYAIGDLFDPDCVDNGIGFTRRFIIVSWSGVACWPSILLLLYKKRKAFLASFVPLVLASLAPTYLSVFGAPVVNYYSAIISAAAFVYLFMAAVVFRRRFE